MSCVVVVMGAHGEISEFPPSGERKQEEEGGEGGEEGGEGEGWKRKSDPLCLSPRMTSIEFAPTA